MTIRLMNIVAIILSFLGSAAFALIGFIIISQACEIFIYHWNWIDFFVSLGDNWSLAIAILGVAGIGGETTALIVARANTRSRIMILVSSLIGSACGSYYYLASYHSILASESWFWWIGSIGSMGTYAVGTLLCILLSKSILAS
jgi:hypothetical protein